MWPLAIKVVPLRLLLLQVFPGNFAVQVQVHPRFPISAADLHGGGGEEAGDPALPERQRSATTSTGSASVVLVTANGAGDTSTVPRRPLHLPSPLEGDELVVESSGGRGCNASAGGPQPPAVLLPGSVSYPSVPAREAGPSSASTTGRPSYYVYQGAPSGSSSVRGDDADNYPEQQLGLVQRSKAATARLARKTVYTATHYLLDKTALLSGLIEHEIQVAGSTRDELIYQSLKQVLKNAIEVGSGVSKLAYADLLQEVERRGGLYGETSW